MKINKNKLNKNSHLLKQKKGASDTVGGAFYGLIAVPVSDFAVTC